MKYLLFLLSIILITLIVSCNKGDNERPQENDQSTTNNSNQDNDEEKDKNGGLNSFVEGMKNIENMMKEGGEYEAIDFRKLKDFLPEELKEMKRVSATGERTNSFGVNVSKTEGKYEYMDGSGNIRIVITDLGSMKGFAGLAAFAWTFADIDKETETGYERTTRYDGNKAFEKYDSQRQQGAVNIFVADRFMVEVEGYNVPMESIKSAVEIINIGELNSMKEEGKRTE